MGPLVSVLPRGAVRRHPVSSSARRNDGKHYPGQARNPRSAPTAQQNCSGKLMAAQFGVGFSPMPAEFSGASLALSRTSRAGKCQGPSTENHLKIPADKKSNPAKVGQASSPLCYRLIPFGVARFFCWFVRANQVRPCCQHVPESISGTISFAVKGQIHLTPLPS